jgi:dihydrofolate reductase
VRTSLVVAASDRDVIGDQGRLPWHLPDDLRRFKRLTSGHVVVLGRRTHEEIVARLGRPLPGRLSVVVSRDCGDPTVLHASSVDAALVTARTVSGFAGRDELFVIGGAAVYGAALPHVDRIHLTRVHTDVDGDTRMPAGWLAGFTRTSTEDGPGCTYEVWE